jgi:hypothetical protein
MPILFMRRSRFIRRSSVGLLSRNVSVSVLVQLAAESAMPPTAAIPRFTGELSQERRPADLVQFTLEHFVRTVGIDPELAFHDFLHSLSRLIEEALASPCSMFLITGAILVLSEGKTLRPRMALWD